MILGIDRIEQIQQNFENLNYPIPKELWDDLIKEEGRIRRSRREAVYAREERNRQIRDYTIIGIASLIGCGAVGWMVWIITLSV